MAERKKPAKKAAAKRTRSTKSASKAKPAAKPKAKAAAKPKAKAAAKPKPKPKAKPEARPQTTEWKLESAPQAAKAAQPKQAKEPQLPPLKKALEWIGMDVDGTDRSLGKLAGLHVDVEDGKPRWAVVRLGRLAGCTALPYDHVAEGGDRLFAAYERGWVREAPRFKPNESLTADQELELCAHWGIRRDKARSAEVQGRKPDEISAVPAES
jgi:histone H1/5